MAPYTGLGNSTQARPTATALRAQINRSENRMKKKWTLAIGVTIGAMVFGMAAVAGGPVCGVCPGSGTATSAPGVSATTSARHELRAGQEWRRCAG